MPEMQEILQNAPRGATKFIHLDRNASGEVVNMKEVAVDNNRDFDTEAYEPFRKLTEAKLAGGHKVKLSLQEALLTNPDAAEILRTGIRFLAFDRFRRMQPTYTGIVSMEQSNKPKEEYLRDAAIGRLEKAPSGTQAPEHGSTFEGGVEIVNDLYRGIFSILGDWVKFDQIGKIRQTADAIGRALAMTREFAVYSALTTTGNYTRNSTTNDNDVGANTSALTFSGLGLEQALATIATAKDRKSGNYLGYAADTIVIGPRMEVPVKQLLMSADLNRTGSGSNEVRGMGTMNQYRGLVNNIIVSPWFATTTNGYQWALFDSSVQWFKFQEVESPNVYQESADMTSETWLTKDIIRFLGRDYFGCGLVDDRAAFYSSSTTAPTVS
jgi:hypothetical protein